MHPPTRPGALRLALALALVLGGCGGGEPVDSDGRPAELVLGLVPSREADVLVDNASDLSAFLAAELGIPVRSFVPQDYTGLVEAMGSGRADIGLIPPFAAMLGRQRYGLETILISVRNGSPTYRSEWVTRHPAVCETTPALDEEELLECRAPLEVMIGEQVAFTDPTSTSGYLYPALQLMDAGIDPESDIQAVFMGGHDAAIIGLYNGDVDFAVAFEGARRLVRPEIPDVGEKLVAFAHSAPIPNDGVTVRGDLPEELKAEIRDAFLAFAERDAGKPQEQRTLWRIYEIDGFVPFEPGTYAVVERAFTELRDKIRL